MIFCWKRWCQLSARILDLRGQSPRARLGCVRMSWLPVPDSFRGSSKRLAHTSAPRVMCNSGSHFFKLTFICSLKKCSSLHAQAGFWGRFHHGWTQLPMNRGPEMSPNSRAVAVWSRHWQLLIHSFSSRHQSTFSALKQREWMQSKVRAAHTAEGRPWHQRGLNWRGLRPYPLCFLKLHAYSELLFSVSCILILVIWLISLTLSTNTVHKQMASSKQNCLPSFGFNSSGSGRTSVSDFCSVE